MRHLLKRRPSPAMAVALTALFVALAGSSYAAVRVGSAEIRNNSVRSVDLRNNQVRSVDLRNNSVRGRDVRTNTLTGADVKESSLGKVANADALDGKDSSDFGPRAFALVDRDGRVDAARSRGITTANVRHPSTGVYCFNGLGFTVKNVTATVEAGHLAQVENYGIADDTRIVAARARPDSRIVLPDPSPGIPGAIIPEPCPGTEQASVVITQPHGDNANPTARTDNWFYVVFN